jgi:hypothetical protein
MAWIRMARIRMAWIRMAWIRMARIGIARSRPPRVYVARAALIAERHVVSHA